MSKIEIFETTKIYVACPTRVATGEPELLYQFATHMQNEVNRFSIKLDQKLINFYFCNIYKNCSYLEKNEQRTIFTIILLLY